MLFYWISKTSEITLETYNRVLAQAVRTAESYIYNL